MKTTSSLLSGAFAISVSVGATRCFSLLSQIALGWFLTKEEFGIYGMAISLTVLVGCFQEGGIIKLLIHRSQKSESIFSMGLPLSLTFTLVAAAILSTSGFFYSRQVGQSIIFHLTIILSISLLISAPIAVHKAACAKDLRFPSIAKITTLSAFTTYSLTILFSWLGFGAFSFVTPLLFAKTLEYILYRGISGLRPKQEGFNFRWCDLISLVIEMRWIMVAAILVATIQRGDYLVLGALSTPTLLGLYFFAFQLTAAFSTLITSAINQVFMPTLSRMNEDPASQNRSYDQALSSILAISMPVLFTASLFIAPAIDMVWGSKWNESIIIAQLLLISLPIRLLPPLGRGLLEARGQWRTAAALLAIDACGTLSFAYWAALEGTTSALAIKMSAWRIIIGLIQIPLVPLLSRRSVTSNIEVFYRLILVQYPLILTTLWIIKSNHDQLDFTHSFLAAVSFLIVSGILATLFSRRIYQQGLQGVLSKFSAIRPTKDLP